MWQQAGRGGSQTTVYCYLNLHIFKYFARNVSNEIHMHFLREASCEFRLWCQMMPLEWSNSESMTDPVTDPVTMMGFGIRSLPYFNLIFLHISSFLDILGVSDTFWDSQINGISFDVCFVTVSQTTRL